MNSLPFALATVILAAMTVSAQVPSTDTERVFPFKYVTQEPQTQEIATVVRALTEIKNLTLDSAKRNLTVRGDQKQLALTEWLMKELDRFQEGESFVHKYQMADTAEGTVRVFHVKNAATPQALQEVATMIRSVG